MRGLWKAAFLVAPALVSAIVLPDVWEEEEPPVNDDFPEKDIEGTNIAIFYPGLFVSSDDAKPFVEPFEYRFQILPSEDICELGNVLVNGIEMSAERIDDDLVGQGSLEIDGHVVEATWRFECIISTEGLSLAQLMTFVPKSIDGTPIEDVKYQMWFDNIIRSTIVDDMPIDGVEDTEDMELDIDAEIAELEQLRDAADYIQSLIREKERAIEQFNLEEFSATTHKCHSMSCFAKMLFHKVKCVIHKIVWKIKHHHRKHWKHGKHGHHGKPHHGNHTHGNCTHRFPGKGNHTHLFPGKGNHTHPFPWKGNHTHPPHFRKPHFRPPPFCHCRPPHHKPPHHKPPHHKPPHMGPPHKGPKTPCPKRPGGHGPPSFDSPPHFEHDGRPTQAPSHHEGPPPPMGDSPPPHRHGGGGPRLHRRPHKLMIALHVAKYVVIGVLLSFVFAAVRRRCCNATRRAEKQARREERHRRRAFRRAAKKQAWRTWFASFVAKRDEEDEKRAMLAGRDDTVGDEIRQFRNAADVVGDIVAAEEGRARVSIGSLPEYASELGEDLPSYHDNDGSEASSHVADGFGYTPGSSEYVASPARSEVGSVRNVFGDAKT